LQIQQVGFLLHWDLYALLSLEAVVTWLSGSGEIEAYLSGQLAAFSAVGWVTWPVKIVLEMCRVGR